MDLKEFNQLKEKLTDIESKIYRAFGIFSCMKCSKCDQKISFFQIIQFFNHKIEDQITCPLCQSTSIEAIMSPYDHEEKFEILEYYIQSIPSQITELYVSNIHCGINPYEKDFGYSQAIVNIFITLESLISKIVVKKLEDEIVLDDLITQYIVERMKPSISDYIELLKTCGLKDVEGNFKKLKSIWNIRNNVVHRGYKADFVDFARVYIGIGEILVYLQSES